MKKSVQKRKGQMQKEVEKKQGEAEAANILPANRSDPVEKSFAKSSKDEAQPKPS